MIDVLGKAPKVSTTQHPEAGQCLGEGQLPAKVGFGTDSHSLCSQGCFPWPDPKTPVLWAGAPHNESFHISEEQQRNAVGRNPTSPGLRC